jgi:hypothetical protein
VFSDLLFIKEYTMLPKNSQSYRKALQACERAAAFHLFDPNITLIDVGWKIYERQNKQITKNLSVRVHLRQKLRGASFEKFAANYPERIVSEQKIRFPIDIIEADYPQQFFFNTEWERSLRTRFYNPLRGGISISSEWHYSYGTLGGIVKDRATGKLMILSNWHVLAGSADARPGIKILQPSFADGGSSYYSIAYYTRNSMHVGIDAAVAELNGNRSVVNDQFEIGPVTGFNEPVLGMVVQKSGRTSGLTSGIITGIAGRKKIWYGGFERIINHVIHIAQNERKAEISAPGDSGSWWLEKDTRRAVGLHFAGSNNPEYALAISMPEVLNALDVEIALQ